MDKIVYGLMLPDQEQCDCEPECDGSCECEQKLYLFTPDALQKRMMRMNQQTVKALIYKLEEQTEIALFSTLTKKRNNNNKPNRRKA